MTTNEGINPFPNPEIRVGEKPILFADVDHSSSTHRGNRPPPNQDSCMSYSQPPPEWILESEELWTPERTEGLRAGHIFTVADGVGGLPRGEKASRTACAAFTAAYLGYIKTATDTREAIIRALQDANASVYKDPEGDGSKATTLSAAIIRGNELFIASIGDSRAYIIRDGKIKLLTQDHSWCERVERNPGDLAIFQAIFGADKHPANQIYKCLGRPSPVLEDAEELVQGPIPLQAEDKILLCTDGLWQYVPEEVLQLIAKQGGATARDRVGTFIDQALKRKTHDNVTALLADVKGFSTTDLWEKQLAAHNKRVDRRRKPGIIDRIFGGNRPR